MSGDQSMIAAVQNATRPDYSGIDLAGLKEQRPDLVQAIEAAHDVSAKTKAAHEEGHAAGLREGAEAERTRIAAIHAHAKGFSGHDALVDQMIADGTSAEAAAAKILDAERAKGPERLQTIQNGEDKLKELQPAPNLGGDKPPTQPQTEEGWKAEYANSSELQAEFASESDYLAFKKAEARGGVKVRDAA